MDLIFLITGLILLCGAIGHGLRLADRIAVASETSAIHLAALFKSLSPKRKLERTGDRRNLRSN